ncbi:hypothetical protein MKW94_013745 [Papaver nudicaule]|uniref:Uncharacterized protein n=1 Tax=Papaver nudicaule TaxID=74823 RepID=A0AA41W0A5_PAPNU|nr:hypothetical protein [Papaver nudicaule]
MVLSNDVDLLNPPAELEKRRHKLKRLVQSPNSFFMFYFKLLVSLHLHIAYNNVSSFAYSLIS